MKKYKHKKTGWEAVYENEYNYRVTRIYENTQRTQHVLPKEVIEDSNDWELVVEKEYEVLELITYNGAKSAYDYPCEGSYCYPLSKSYASREHWINHFLEAKVQGISQYWFINKVKCLKTNEVFQIGDKVTNPAGHVFTIGKFYLDCNQNHMLVGSENGCGAGHVNITKIKKYVETVLFTTEDGVDITEGMEYWFTLGGDSKYTITSDRDLGYTPLHRFSTEEALDEYLAKKKEEEMLDKPVLSYNEVEKILTNNCYRYTFDKLKELVKSKQ